MTLGPRSKNILNETTGGFKIEERERDLMGVALERNSKGPSETKISNLKDALFLVHKKVLWFEISAVEKVRLVIYLNEINNVRGAVRLHLDVRVSRD